MTRKDGIAYPGYHKFEPRIIARSIRILLLSYRMVTFYAGGGMTVELFGCSYGTSKQNACHTGGPEVRKLNNAIHWIGIFSTALKLPVVC